MNRYTAITTVTTVRTVVERASITQSVQAESFEAASRLLEGETVIVQDAEFETVSDETRTSDSVLSSITFVSSDEDLRGLTPALYEPSPSPSGKPYFPIQTEPTPVD